MLNAKKWLFMAAGLTAGCAAATVYFQPLRGEWLHGQQAASAGAVSATITSVHPANAQLGFGPEMEAILPASSSGRQIQMLNLQTGGWGTSPGLDCSIEEVPALVAWMRNNGVNISSRVWPGGSADCITYNMTVIPVDTDSWEKAAAEATRGIPEPILNQHSPRRLLVLEAGKAKTYAFRTDAGALGLVRLVGLSDDGQGVKIRYKLVQAMRPDSLGSQQG